jgi:hypothetical protein
LRESYLNRLITFDSMSLLLVILSEVLIFSQHIYNTYVHSSSFRIFSNLLVVVFWVVTQCSNVVLYHIFIVVETSDFVV